MGGVAEVKAASRRWGNFSPEACQLMLLHLLEQTLCGRSMHVVSQSMERSDIITTLRVYVHVLPQQRKDLAEAMGSMLLRPQQEAVG